MKDGVGFDILGVCEVEDEYVFGDLSDILNDQLYDWDYGIVYVMNDVSFCGIDIVFIYDMFKFIVDLVLVFNYFVMCCIGIWDILQVMFKFVVMGGEIVVMVNYWLLWYGGNGKVVSVGFRVIVVEILVYWYECICELFVVKECMLVIVFGDMNDDLWDDSVMINVLVMWEWGDVECLILVKFYNLMWEYLLIDVIDY